MGLKTAFLTPFVVNRLVIYIFDTLNVVGNRILDTLGSYMGLKTTS